MVLVAKEAFTINFILWKSKERSERLEYYAWFLSSEVLSIKNEHMARGGKGGSPAPFSSEESKPRTAALHQSEAFPKCMACLGHQEMLLL